MIGPYPVLSCPVLSCPLLHRTCAEPSKRRRRRRPSLPSPSPSRRPGPIVEICDMAGRRMTARFRNKLGPC
ncbi:hypothetical protein P167DRAFT_540387 [Morchella conica CCBAS932]|uniref:Uncharacterized protein n=1 Tax=Morchella conica CCBAS932 TaxID=1392247 RepID=A0A3N4KCM7_9PEZI|nr:hypothetical protein P167DRAFT_540387 [Morchella conica CCBAS932]